MQSLDSYLKEYSRSHQNPRNIVIHNICVPLITWSVIAVAQTFVIAEPIRLSHVIAVGALIFYSAFRNWRVVVAMAAEVGVIFLTFLFIPHLRAVGLAVFVLAWIGQFYGHKIEGQKPSFFKDLLFLLIGPVWVLMKALPGFFRRAN